MPKIKDLGIKVIPETMRPPEAGGGAGCGATAAQACFPTHLGCTDCTFQAFSICGGTKGCTDCTLQPFSFCGGTCAFNTYHGCGHVFSHCGCTLIAITAGCGASVACGPLSLPCGAFTNCGAISPVCGGSIIDTTIVQQPGIQLTVEQVAALKESLKRQMAALDEHEKTIGTRTTEAIDAREKQLNDELAQLKARRKDLK